jgi:protein-tyrosine phosphatase
MKKYIPKRYKRYIKLLWRNILQSVKYYLLDGNLFKKKPLILHGIIFVCKGNICRSAFADIKFRQYCQNDKTMIDSCGISVDQGDYPPEEAVSVAIEFSCEKMAQRRSKSLACCDLERADLILPMEYEQYKYLCSLLPNNKNIRLTRQYAPGITSFFCNIDDPFSWGEKEYRKTFKLIDCSLKELRKYLQY